MNFIKHILFFVCILCGGAILYMGINLYHAGFHAVDLTTNLIAIQNIDPYTTDDMGSNGVTKPLYEWYVEGVDKMDSALLYLIVGSLLIGSSFSVLFIFDEFERCDELKKEANQGGKENET